MKKLALIVLLVYASLSAASVVFVKGAVRVQSGDKTDLAISGQSLSEGSKITTGKASFVVLEVNGHRIKLDPASSLIIKHEAEKRSEFELLNGGVMSRVNKLQDDEDFIILSQQVVAGVRGTEFYFSSGKKRLFGDDDLWLCVNEGTVAVTTPENEVEVNEGEGIQIKRGKRSSEPRFFSWTRQLNWSMQGSEDELNEIDEDSFYKRNPEDVDY